LEAHAVQKEDFPVTGPAPAVARLVPAETKPGCVCSAPKIYPRWNDRSAELQNFGWKILDGGFSKASCL